MTGVTTSQAVTITVTLTVTTPTLTMAVSPSTTISALACGTANAPTSAAYTTAAQTINIQLSGAPPAGTSVTIAAAPAAYTVNGGSSVAASLSPLVVNVPANTLNSTNWSTGINVSINAQPYCAHANGLGASAPTFSLTATPAGGISGQSIASQTITVDLTVSQGPSPLTASPSAVSINCTWDGSTGYTPGTAQNVSITGPAAAALTFTVSSKPGWAVLNPTTISGQSATASPYTFTVQAAAACGSYTDYNSHQGAIHLTNGLNLDKVINVTLNMVHPTVLQATPNPAPLTYIKGSGIAGHVDVAIADGMLPLYYTVDTTSLGTWLTVDSTSGTAPGSIRFSSTSIADTMAPGLYAQKVRVGAMGYGDLQVTINMQVSNPASRLTVTGAPTTGCTVSGPTQSCTWVMGQPLPTLYINLQSSDAPIPYTISTGGTLAPIVTQTGGLAYPFGTSIPVNFNQAVFSGVVPGTMVSGTVGITSGSPASTYVVTFNITATAPGAILTAVSPTIVPALALGQHVTVVLQGSGFVQSSDPAQQTTVGIVSGSSLIPDPNFSVNVLNPSNILLTITNSGVDANLPYGTASPGAATIGICNPTGSTCNTPTGSATLTFGAQPIIVAVTSASAYMQASSPSAYPNVAPYDIISIFGSNLCPVCVGSNPMMSGTPQGANLAYPSTLSYTDLSSVTYNLQVAFKTHAATPSTTPATLAGVALTGSPVYAPLLFATNNQINLLAPSAISAAIAGNPNAYVDMVVSFGAAGSVQSSSPYAVTAVTSDPGIFTIAADGQGDGAILDSTYAVVGQGNPAAMRKSAGSDTIMIYMTGLGAPLSAGDNAAAATDGTSGAGHVWSADCISATSASSPTGYTTSLGSLTGVTPSTVDGLILQGSLINTGRFVPCLDKTSQPPAVTIGGVALAASSIKYAGWVSDSVAGLYQVNALLPSTTGSFKPTTADCSTFTGTGAAITQPTQLPICVTTKDGAVSQPGVTIWVAPRLSVAAPAVLSGSVGVSWASTNTSVVATDGTSSYTYVLQTGVLPSGLVLNINGSISGTPNAGTNGPYPVTVLATDSLGVTGTVSFTVTVGPVLTMTAAPSNTSFTVGATSTAKIFTVTASGGAGGYTYAITTGGDKSMVLGGSSGDFSLDGTDAASTTFSNVVITATDKNGLTGTFTFSVTTQ
jgi:uncharacterized protein (TIGR03437 family)